jgi:hypothetical protein
VAHRVGDLAGRPLPDGVVDRLAGPIVEIEPRVDELLQRITVVGADFNLAGERVQSLGALVLSALEAPASNRRPVLRGRRVAERDLSARADL